MLGLILPQDNPYRLNPYHGLWNRGYNETQQKFEPVRLQVKPVKPFRPWQKPWL